MSEQLEKAQNSLKRVQEFDPTTLPREVQLGELNFAEAVEPSRRIIELFRQFPIQFLADLPPNQQSHITAQADSFYQILASIEKFSAKQPDPSGTRTNLIQTLKGQYQPYFDSLFPLIAYGASRQRDFASLERDFRASMQRAEDSAGELMKKLEAQEQDGQRILEEVRKVAAEQGVSQQALYFHQESDLHDKEAENWRFWTIVAAAVLAGYAMVSAFAHHIPGLVPENTYQAFQLGLSKVLLFAVLAYMLLLCARNFLSHKHNAIVNKHRQNALLTFKALVDAAGSEERRDVILTYAAACIFSPQDTGYTKGTAASQSEMPMNIIQSLPKLVATNPPH